MFVQLKVYKDTKSHRGLGVRHAHARFEKTAHSPLSMLRPAERGLLIRKPVAYKSTKTAEPWNPNAPNPEQPL